MSVWSAVAAIFFTGSGGHFAVGTKASEANSIIAALKIEQIALFRKFLKALLAPSASAAAAALVMAMVVVLLVARDFQ
jgi:hypothetical protein